MSPRQERTRRRRDADLRRASTSAPGRGPSPILLGTLAAIVLGAALVGFAILSSQNQGAGAALRTPAFVTDASIPQSGTSGMTLGQPSAPVAVDLWEDYQCPGCAYLSTQIEPSLVRDYVATGKVSLVYHDYLLIDQGGGTESLQAANATRCAGDQGKYWQFHDWLFFNQGPEHSGQYSADRLLQFGRQLNLDMSKFEPCVRNGTHEDDVRAQSTQSPVKSTPGVFVAGKKVVSARGEDYIPTYAEIRAAIDSALRTSSPAPVASPSA